MRPNRTILTQSSPNPHLILTIDAAQTKKLTQSVQLAVGLMVGAELGAAATAGTVVATSLLDPSFIAFAGVLGAMPILIMPYAKSTHTSTCCLRATFWSFSDTLLVITASLKTSFRENVATLSDELDDALTQHLEAELTRSVQDIKASYSPFDRFVRSEQRAIAEQKAGLQETLGELRAGLGEVA